MNSERPGRTPRFRNRRAERLEMIRSQIAARGAGSRRVQAAIACVPRHEFVPDALADHAYDDAPLSIAERQTISQPYIVAIMTDALELKRTDRVLEIGTGSGYQTAVLAELAAHVFTIERLPALAESARERLERCGYRNVSFRVADGTLGWPEAAPFDAIIVTAAAPGIPPALAQQLAPSGRLVLPVGSLRDQELLVATWQNGQLVTRPEGPVRFVPLLGRQGFEA